MALLLSQAEIRSLIGPAAALRQVRSAFVLHAAGQAQLPGAISLAFPERQGEVHVKSASLATAAHFAVKIASGFYQNPARGLPVSDGVMLAFDAQTGRLAGVLLDDGYLTELRTGAAGALAADLLGKPTAGTIGIIGAGTQAEYQLEALLQVRNIRLVRVYGRSREKAESFAATMSGRLAIPVEAVATVQEAVEQSEILVTATPSRTPMVRAEWVRPGLHISAIGADTVGKQELDVAVLRKADKIVVDDLSQCSRLGEVQHLLRLFPDARIHAELGLLAAGMAEGRTSDAEITIADLTGLGIQDTAVADFVMCEARRRGVGRTLPRDGRSDA